MRNSIKLAAVAALLAVGLTATTAAAQAADRFEVTVTINGDTSVYTGNIDTADPFRFGANGADGMTINGCITGADLFNQVCFSPITLTKLEALDPSHIFFDPTPVDGHATGTVRIGNWFDGTEVTFTKASARIEATSIAVTGFGLWSNFGLCEPECAIPPKRSLATIQVVDLAPPT